MACEKMQPAEPTKEQLEIAELAAPLSRYLSDNVICGEVIVTMNTVALRWEGFTAEYSEDYCQIKQPSKNLQEGENMFKKTRRKYERQYKMVPV